MYICNKQYSDGKSPARITHLLRSYLTQHGVLPQGGGSRACSARGEAGTVVMGSCYQNQTL